MGNMQVGLATFNQQPCSPEPCHAVGLAKAVRFVNAAPVLAKKGHCSKLIFEAVNILAFWTPRNVPPQYMLYIILLYRIILNSEGKIVRFV